MERCHQCVYSCFHKNKKYTCWNCFTSNHLLANDFKIDNMDFFLCNEDIRIKIMEHPGYILCYNYQHKIYKLLKVQDLVYTNFYLIKHLVSIYLSLINKKKMAIKVNDMLITDCSILDEVFKQEYMFDLDTFKVIKV